jgi:hypothetical protein
VLHHAHRNGVFVATHGMRSHGVVGATTIKVAAEMTKPWSRIFRLNDAGSGCL